MHFVGLFLSSRFVIITQTCACNCVRVIARVCVFCVVNMTESWKVTSSFPFQVLQNYVQFPSPNFRSTSKFAFLRHIIQPCILSSITNEMQRYTIFFIAVNAVHVSGGFSTHHQELINCTHSIWYMSSLLAATASVGEFQLTHARRTTVLSSWWWGEKPPETCRALTAIKNIVWRCILLVYLKEYINDTQSHERQIQSCLVTLGQSAVCSWGPVSEHMWHSPYIVTQRPNVN